jgi:hypothetical protein
MSWQHYLVIAAVIGSLLNPQIFTFVVIGTLGHLVFSCMEAE